MLNTFGLKNMPRVLIVIGAKRMGYYLEGTV